jgi:hypothetical protein
MKHPIAFYLRPVNSVVYGHNGPGSELRHEAMHALDPCGYDRGCTEDFAKGLPPELAQTARDLYGKKNWSPIECWAVVPAWYLWEPDMMPMSVRRSYSSVFRIE